MLRKKPEILTVGKLPEDLRGITGRYFNVVQQLPEALRILQQTYNYAPGTIAPYEGIVMRILRSNNIQDFPGLQELNPYDIRGVRYTMVTPEILQLSPWAIVDNRTFRRSPNQNLQPGTVIPAIKVTINAAWRGRGVIQAINPDKSLEEPIAIEGVLLQIREHTASGLYFTLYKGYNSQFVRFKSPYPPNTTM